MPRSAPRSWRVAARRLWLLLSLVLGVGFGSPSQAVPGRLAASLLASSDRPAPGQGFWIGLRLVPDPGWHSYWSNPGDSGLAPTIEWRAPAGLSFGALEHPAPTMLQVMGITSFVHAGDHLLLARARLMRSVAPGTALPIDAHVRWLACSESLCVPGEASLHLDLVAGDGAPSAAAAFLRRAEQRLPSRAPPGTFAEEGGRLVLRLPRDARLGAAGLAFFPDRNGVIDAGGERAVRQDDGLAILVPAARPDIRSLSGIVSDGRNAYRIRFRRLEAPASVPQPIGASRAGSQGAGIDGLARAQAAEAPTAAPPPGAAAPAAGGAAPSIVAALLAALIGGLLLNLMPCVFPVLSIKAVALARAGTSQRAARLDAIAFTAGAVAACTGLGLLIMLLRLGGDEVGWSFQLQHPGVTLALVLLATAITLNLAGLFELPSLSIDSAPARPGTPWASIGAGALSAFVATPCSGPFMAGALGATLLFPPFVSLAIYAALGLGLALPMLGVAFVPRVRTALPAPGPWMESFRRWMALPTGLAALALIWLLQRQAGTGAAGEAALLVLVLGASLGWLGARQRRGGDGAWPALVPLAAAAVGLALVAPVARPAAATPGSPAVQPFSEARLEQLRSRGVPVFVDITADWCLTCKINERIAIDRRETRDAFGKAGIVTLRGDWTNGDPAITHFLAAHGRNSIPFYLFYPPGQAPQMLPQLLSAGSLRQLARSARVNSVQPTPSRSR